MNPEKFSQAENQWVVSLLEEAKRDLVFVFNIAAGAFGGPTGMPTEEVPGVIERMARSLLDGGCIVGFGDPDSASWRVPETLAVPRSDVPATVKKLWEQDPETYQFLVFARRLR